MPKKSAKRANMQRPTLTTEQVKRLSRGAEVIVHEADYGDYLIVTTSKGPRLVRKARGHRRALSTKEKI